jgi:hypothetical protein
VITGIGEVTVAVTFFDALCQPPNYRLQRTVRDKVPEMKRGRPATEPDR